MHSLREFLHLEFPRQLAIESAESCRPSLKGIMSTYSASRPPDWKDLYQLAVIELDPAKLSNRITDARNAILDRIQETISVAHYQERQELTDALNGLRVLQQE